MSEKHSKHNHACDRNSPASSYSKYSLSEWHTSDYATSTSSEGSFAPNDHDEDHLNNADKKEDLNNTRQCQKRSELEFASRSTACSIVKSSPVSTRIETSGRLASLGRDTTEQSKLVISLERSILDTLRSLNDFKSLTNLQSSLSTPILGHQPVDGATRFAEENLPPYDRAIISAKLEELSKLESLIHSGCQQYDILRNLLATKQWSDDHALKHWNKMYMQMSCNEERSAADYLLTTIPFQLSTSGSTDEGTKRRGRGTREYQVPELHMRINFHARTWRGHTHILRNHLEMHLRVFGPDSLPGLPKEVLQLAGDLPPKVSDDQLSEAHEEKEDETSTVDGKDNKGEEEEQHSMDAREYGSRPPKRQMVKSHSRKALQVLGIK